MLGEHGSALHLGHLGRTAACSTVLHGQVEKKFSNYQTLPK